jgi:hypothetical protein
MAVNYLTIKLKENIHLIKAVKKIPEIMGICNCRPLTDQYIQPLQGWHHCLRLSTRRFTTGYSSSSPSGLVEHILLLLQLADADSSAVLSPHTNSLLRYVVTSLHR